MRTEDLQTEIENLKKQLTELEAKHTFAGGALQAFEYMLKKAQEAAEEATHVQPPTFAEVKGD